MRMEKKSEIAKVIDTTDQETQYDNCVKRILSEKVILAWILKECVNEFRKYSILEIMNDCIEGAPKVSTVAVDQDELDYDEQNADKMIEGMNTEDSSAKEGKIYYDIRFMALIPDTKEPIQLIINVEAQKSDKTTYPLIKRGIYYGSRMISAQKNRVFTNRHYEKIRKVYSIWIQMNVSKARANTITRYRIVEENVVGGVKEKESNYDLLTVIMLGLGNAEGALEEPILRLLDVLLSISTKPEEKKKILERDFDIKMTAKMREEANVMCNLGEGIRERTALETQARAVLNLMKSMKLTVEEAISAIGVPDNDRDSLLEIVDRQLLVK